MVDEKRIHKRTKATLRVQYSVISQAHVTPHIHEQPSVIKDISQSGLALRTKKEVPMEAMVRVTIESPYLPFNLMILGKVVRCEYVEELKQYLVGLKFIGHLPPEISEIIEMYGSELKAN